MRLVSIGDDEPDPPGNGPSARTVASNPTVWLCHPEQREWTARLHRHLLIDKRYLNRVSFFEMETHSVRRASGIRLLLGATTLAVWAMVAITTLMVIMCAVVLSGRGSVTITSVLEAPYSVGFEDDRSITVGAAGNVTAYTNFEIGEESRYFDAAPKVTAPVLLDREDTDSRIVGVIGVLSLLTLAWVALLQQRRIVRSARDGDPFDPRNVARFRWLAATVLVAWLVLEAGERILTRTLDVDIPVEASLTQTGVLPVLGVTLGLLGLSEIFRAGSELRAFERETV